jgi:hypothetical protein
MIGAYVVAKHGTSIGGLIYEHFHANEWDKGAAKTPAPFEHDEENDALYFMPDPFGGDEACKRLARAINVLRAQIRWRKTDLNAASPSYLDHKLRIGILSAALPKLESAYRNICGGECPPPN